MVLRESGLILGIETSCDETAAAVVRGGREVLSNVVASQIALHANYGGVVPELASREHLRNIVPIVREAMARAEVGFGDLDAVAVTHGPGLAGALLVGILYAKALAFGVGRPLIAVNHLEGHIHAVLMEARQRGERMLGPLLALVVSGGHTHLYLAEGGEQAVWRYRNVGRTVDDAAGEAYDKVAKLLGLGYPGGPWIDRLASLGDAKAVPFHFGVIGKGPMRDGQLAANKKRPVEEEGARFDFSFSGIKSAVLRYVEAHGMREGAAARHRAIHAGANFEAVRVLCDKPVLDLIASFQGAVVGVLIRRTMAAAETYGAGGIVVSGGVAANRELRLRFTQEAEGSGIPVAFPSPALATDNAAMIAAAAWGKLAAGDFAEDTMGATPHLKLG